MNCWKLIIVSHLLFFTYVTQAQKTELIRTFEIPRTSAIQSDHLGNLYLIDNSTLKKFSSKGELLFEYNNPGLGNITYINVFNPLNVLVFYEESNQYIFLDNRLNPNLNTFTPANSGYYDVQLAATKDQNNIWFYDQVNDKIHLWSLNSGSVINSSLQIGPFVNYKERPNYLYATIKNVYLNIPDIGIIVFDNFGSFEKTIPIKNLETFFLSDNSILFKSNLQIEEFNYFTKKSQNLDLTIEEFEDFSISGDQLFILKNNMIHYFRILKN